MTDLLLTLLVGINLIQLILAFMSWTQNSRTYREWQKGWNKLRGIQ